MSKISQKSQNKHFILSVQNFLHQHFFALQKCEKYTKICLTLLLKLSKKSVGECSILLWLLEIYAVTAWTPDQRMLYLNFRNLE